MTDSTLDTRATYERLDPEGLLDRITGLPGQFEEAYAAARALDLPADYRTVTRIAVLGMGGSGIGGNLLRALAIDLGASTPVDVVRGYVPPAYIDGRTLAIASSNSGNTEETVAAFGGALAAGAKCIAITTGGKLAAMAREDQAPTLAFEWAGEPRSALGWSFASLLAICGGLGLMPDVTDDFGPAVDGARALVATVGPDVPEASNAAKQLARRLAGRLPVVIGAEALTPVAYRWRTQVNENGKSWATSEELPEMNHNAPLGYAMPKPLLPLLHVVLLRHASMHPRNKLRVEATLQQLHAAGVAAEVLDVPGATVLAQMLWAIEFGDLMSFYLGLLHGVHPSPMGALEWLKELMASR